MRSRRRRRNYLDDMGLPRRVDRDTLGLIANHVRDLDRTSAAQPRASAHRPAPPPAAAAADRIERDFFVLDPQRGVERLAAK